MGLKASEGEQVHICCIFLIDIGKSINKQNCGVSCPRNTLENDMVPGGSTDRPPCFWKAIESTPFTGNI